MAAASKWSIQAARWWSRVPTDRAVSEVVGFILVFSLVLGTISIVYVGGFSGLQDARDHEQHANAERAFDVLANNFEELGRDKAPSRATEIKLSDAGIRTTEPSIFSINTTGYMANGSAPRSILYEPVGSDTSIVYDAGEDVRADGDDAIMVREPDFIFGPDRMVLRVMELRGGLQSVSGDTTTLIRGEKQFQEIRHQHHDPATPVNTTIRIEPSSGYTGVWETYLDESLTEAFPSGSHECQSQDTEVICTDIETHSVYFSTTGVRIHIV